VSEELEAGIHSIYFLEFSFAVESWHVCLVEGVVGGIVEQYLPFDELICSGQIFVKFLLHLCHRKLPFPRNVLSPRIKGDT